jgi:hypothetical protein
MITGAAGPPYRRLPRPAPPPGPLPFWRARQVAISTSAVAHGRDPAKELLRQAHLDRAAEFRNLQRLAERGAGQRDLLLK